MMKSVLFFLSSTLLISSVAYASSSGDCGITDELYSEQYIWGGTEALRSQWPWLVKLSRNGIHLCGGALVGDRFVVTAAHCIENINDLSSYQASVRAPGTNDEAEMLGIESVILHEEFIPEARRVARLHHDIAVLKLSRKPRTVTKLCLPKTRTKSPSNHSTCVVAGWGEIEDGVVNLGSLRHVYVPIVPKRVCEREWGNVNLDDSVICAGKYGMTAAQRRGSCAGDSGGPLMCQVGYKWFMFGVVNFGSQACLQRPGAYANVKNLLTWINNAMISLNAETTTTAPASATNTGCPASTLHNPDNNKCYWTLPDRLNWEEARNRCTRDNGILVTIQTANEFNFLRNYFVSSGGWIGLHKSKAGFWQWVDGTPAGSIYQKWNRHEPSGDGNCGHLWKEFNAYNDFPCHGKRSDSFCQIQL